MTSILKEFAVNYAVQRIKLNYTNNTLIIITDFNKIHKLRTYIIDILILALKETVHTMLTS